MGRPLSFEAIKALVPQRFPMICVDRVLDYAEGRSLTALKNVSGNDPHFLGHFPHMAVMPGALVIEGLAQSILVLYELTYGSLAPNDVPLFASAEARFLHPVVPGDQLIYEVQAIKMVSTAGIFNATARVDGAVVARAKLSFVKRQAEAVHVAAVASGNHG